ncbi:MAG TPA: ribonuclease III [Chlamydiales bacterium]|jgi:ribonuclease-3
MNHLIQQLELVEERLGYVFSNKELLLTALIHRSFINENKNLGNSHNERLEFLGDSVLGLSVADYLYRRLPNHSEGVLSQLRSKLVDASSCAAYLRALKLEEFILLGRGEQMTEGRNKNSICADAFEAVIGAIYLDGGLAITKSFLLCHFERVFEEAIGSPPRNYKAELQDYAQKKFQKIPIYKVAQESGPDHAKIFHVVVYVDSQEVGLGLGSSKKEAEQRAAFEALSKMQ